MSKSADEGSMATSVAEAVAKATWLTFAAAVGEAVGLATLAVAVNDNGTAAEAADVFGVAGNCDTSHGSKTIERWIWRDAEIENHRSSTTFG
jgi:hypothetical protein